MRVEGRRLTDVAGRRRTNVLGFVVISKKIPTRTQDHVMHSNEGRVLSTYPTQTDCGSDDTT